jgi:hypothetical protein
MNPRSTILLGCISFPFALAGCGGVSGEALGNDESASTADGGDTLSNADAAGCANVAAGPFAPQLVAQPFSGSEDFAFDGRGHIAGKRGNALVLFGAEGSRNVASLPGQVYGLRYHPNGDLIAAIPGAGKLVAVTPAGQVTELLGGLGTPNGVYVDFEGNVWLTEFGANKVSRLGADGSRTTIASGAAVAQNANGVVLDAAKKVLFYTEYAKGKIHRVALDAMERGPTLVATIPGAALDGIALDACGNLYAADQGSSKLYRVRVDLDGAASAAPELLATFPTNIANAQFGSGPGFDPKKLYVTGNPGAVYALDVGVSGAPVPTPAR